MYQLRGLPRTFLLLSAFGGLAVSGFVLGCGPEAVQTSRSEPPETKGAKTGVDKSKLPKLPKNVNPSSSNRGIKKEYAD
jgi:hypothetical protein